MIVWERVLGDVDVSDYLSLCSVFWGTSTLGDSYELIRKVIDIMYHYYKETELLSQKSDAL